LYVYWLFAVSIFVICFVCRLLFLSAKLLLQFTSFQNGDQNPCKNIRRYSKYLLDDQMQNYFLPSIQNLEVFQRVLAMNLVVYNTKHAVSADDM
jgi:hypothetical protein